MDFVTIIYRYVNRFINSDELIDLLKHIDKSKFPKEENEEIEALLEEVEKLVESIPIEIDQTERKRLASLNHILKDLKKIATNKENSNEWKRFAQNKYHELSKEKEKTRDSGPRYEKLYHLFVNHPLYMRYFQKMNDLELLKFITQYIYAPITPDIDQDTFDKLVTVGMKEDMKEALWRLAFNYNGKKKDFTRIENYFIETRDDYYLTELISAVKEDLNMNQLIDKVINTKDRNFIIDCGKKAKQIGIFTDEEMEKLKDRMKGE